MKRRKDRRVILSVEIRRETKRAVLVSTDGEKTAWLPISQIEIYGESRVALPEWLAIEKELV